MQLVYFLLVQFVLMLLLILVVFQNKNFIQEIINTSKISKYYLKLFNRFEYFFSKVGSLLGTLHAHPLGGTQSTHNHNLPIHLDCFRWRYPTYIIFVQYKNSNKAYGFYLLLSISGCFSRRALSTGSGIPGSGSSTSY